MILHVTNEFINQFNENFFYNPIISRLLKVLFVLDFSLWNSSKFHLLLFGHSPFFRGLAINWILMCKGLMVWCGLLVILISLECEVGWVKFWSNFWSDKILISNCGGQVYVIIQKAKASTLVCVLVQGSPKWILMST